jgi:uncharacterized pyridoxamine 5'-phosphate oxidase family protein
MEEVYEFLKKCGAYYLATAEGDQPRVRPFGTYLVYDGRLYIQTGKSKPVSKQMAVNPKIEITAFDGESGTWLRVAATAVEDHRLEAQEAMLDAFPQLKEMYSAGDGNTQVLYLKDATATFASLSGESRSLTF